MKGQPLDPISLALGFIAGILTVILFGWFFQTVKWAKYLIFKRASRLKIWITVGDEERYREHIVNYTQSQHLGNRAATLESIYVPCRLILPPPEPQPETGDIIPCGQLDFLWPEMSALVTGKKNPTISLFQMTTLSQRTALIAPAGGGKSAAIAFIALKIARKDPPFSSTCLPVYLHLAQIKFDKDTAKQNQKPVEDPLIRAVQKQDKRLSSQSLYSTLQKALHEMRAVVLLDGWDELEPVEREDYTAWIEKLVDAYPENQFILTGPMDGYGPLMRLGFIPLWIKSWEIEEVVQLARRWARVLGLSNHAGEKDELSAKSSPISLDFWQAGQLPLDVTFNLWLEFEENKSKRNRTELFRTTLQSILTPLGRGNISWPLEIGEKVFCQLAHELDNSSIITSQQLKQSIRQVFKSMEKTNRRFEQECLKALGKKSGLLTQLDNKRMVFRTPALKYFFWSSYCTRLQGITLESIEKWPVSDLSEILGFLFELSDPSVMIDKLLAAPHGHLYDNLFIAAHSVREISGNEPSKRQILVQLARLMANSQAPFVLRERAVAALVNSRDEGIVYLLCKAAKSPDEKMRILAAPGLGALASPSHDLSSDNRILQALIEGANQESDPTRSIFIHALTSTRSQAGLDETIRILLKGKPDARRIAAEALSHIGQGRKILLEALEEKDAQVRRAALFGIAKFPDPWALLMLEKAIQEDNDWHVRSTSEDLIANRENEHINRQLQPPLPENMGWLVSWAAKQGDGVPVGERALLVLQRVLKDAKEPEYKAAAARTLGDINQESFLTTIENALQDKEPLVYEAAFFAYVKLHRAWNSERTLL